MATALQTVKIDGTYYYPGDTIPNKALTAEVKASLSDEAVKYDEPRKRDKAPEEKSAEEKAAEEKAAADAAAAAAAGQSGQ